MGAAAPHEPPQAPEPARPGRLADRPERTGARRALLALLLLVVVAGLVAGVIAVAGDDDEGSTAAGAEAPAEMTFSAMAQGVAEVTAVGGDARRDEVNTELTFLESPHGIQTGSVHEFVEAGRGSPVLISDATYTLVADGGDMLTLAAAGTGLQPPNNSTPDRLFLNSTEQWTVKDGTGRFAGARGEGFVYGATVSGALGDGRNPEAKVFVGTLELAGG